MKTWVKFLTLVACALIASVAYDTIYGLVPIAIFMGLVLADIRNGF